MRRLLCTLSRHARFEDAFAALPEKMLPPSAAAKLADAFVAQPLDGKRDFLLAMVKKFGVSDQSVSAAVAELQRSAASPAREVRRRSNVAPQAASCC